jgi:hypothetical protein
VNTADPNNRNCPCGQETPPPRGRVAYLVVHGNAYAFLDETGDTSVGNLGHAPLLDGGTPDWDSFGETEQLDLDPGLEQVRMTAAEALRTAIAAHNAWLIS